MSKLSLDNAVIIVGAGRSGTTMLKDVLASHPDFFAAKYELNYLWRYGNSCLDHDMLEPSLHFSAHKANYIRKKLTLILQQSDKQRLIEKTVANVLRLKYVHTVLPQAKIIHIIRDGRAVTASAISRWKFKPSGSYFASKGLTIPLRSMPVVVFNYLKNRLRSTTMNRDYIQSWGPRWPGIDQDVKELSLPEVCAKQWLISTKTAMEQKASIRKAQYLEVRYEKLVTQPLEEFTRIAEFLAIDPTAEQFHHHISNQIIQTSLNKWEKKLTGVTLEKIMRIINDWQISLGYQ